MKKTITIILLSILAGMTAYADEGMWLPNLIQERIKSMRKMGFKLSASDVYSTSKPSLKDAVVQFGGGCTGEFVSEQGLLLTNHHCGYGSIQKLSSVEHDYLTYGYWAKSLEEELPVPGLTVSLLVKMEDVTARLANGEKKQVMHDIPEHTEGVKFIFQLPATIFFLIIFSLPSTVHRLPSIVAWK